MTLLLQILMGLVAVICLLVSSKLLRQGHKLFPSIDVHYTTGLDNLLRFFGGLMLGFSMLCVWAVVTVNVQSNLNYFLGLSLLFAALGRLLSRQTVGVPPSPRELFMWAEFVLGLAIIALQCFRSHV